MAVSQTQISEIDENSQGVSTAIAMHIEEDAEGNRIMVESLQCQGVDEELASVTAVSGTQADGEDIVESAGEEMAEQGRQDPGSGVTGFDGA